MQQVLQKTTPFHSLRWWCAAAFLLGVLPVSHSSAAPPRAKPPVVTLVQEPMSKDALDKLEKDLIRAKYATTLRSGQLDNAARKVIQDWATWQINRMCLKEHAGKVQSLNDRLIRDIRSAGRLQKANRQKLMTFRHFVCQQITDLVTEVALKNNMEVRINGVILLGSINHTEEAPDAPLNLKERAFVPALKPLVDVLNAKTGGELNEQTQAVKIRAAHSIGRILLHGTPEELTVTRKNEAIQALIKELGNTENHPWYQEVLLESIGKSDVTTDRTGAPIVLDALGKVLTDPNRTLCVRAAAAKAIGRSEVPANADYQLLTHRIVALGHEMAAAYQKDTKNPKWPGCFLNLYFAFRPEGEKEKQEFALLNRTVGILQKKNTAPVADAYKQVFPLAAFTQKNIPVANGPAPPKMPDAVLTGLQQWLTKTKPTNKSLAPGLDALPELPAAAGNDNVGTASN